MALLIEKLNSLAITFSHLGIAQVIRDKWWLG